MSGSQSINQAPKFTPLIFSEGKRVNPQVETYNKIDFTGIAKCQGSQPVPQGGIYAILGSNGLNVELSPDGKSGSIFYPGPGAYTKVTADPKGTGDKFDAAAYLAEPRPDVPYVGEPATTRKPEAKSFQSSVDIVGVTASGGDFYQGSQTPIGDKQADFLKKHQGEIKDAKYVEHKQDNVFSKAEADALLFGITTNPELRKEAEEAGYKIVEAKGDKTGFEDVNKVLIDSTANPIILPDSTVKEINSHNNGANLTKDQLKKLSDRPYDTTRTTGELKP